jgi:hypothetical protein
MAYREGDIYQKGVFGDGEGCIDQEIKRGKGQEKR